MEDKRQAARASKFIPVMIEDSKVNMLFRANIGDLSYDGMRVMVTQFLPKGTQYMFSLKFTPPIKVKGEVRWISSMGTDSFRVGIHFLEMTPQSEEMIRKIVDHELNKKQHHSAI